MSDSENALRESIISHLKKGYGPDTVNSLIQFNALLGIWSIKGKTICTANDIHLVAMLTPDEVKNEFKPKQVIPTEKKLTELAVAVELDLAKTPFDFESLNLFDHQTEKNSLTLLTDLLTKYKEKLGNSLANETFALTIQSIYDNSKINENTEGIYKSVIQLRYLEGYSNEVIQDILSFKINLMEWSEKGFQFIDEDSLELIYKALRKNQGDFQTTLTPRTSEEAALLTENLVTNLAKLEIDPNQLLANNSNENAIDLLLALIKNYRAKIGSELMEQTFTSLLMEILTETSNYNNQKLS